MAERSSAVDLSSGVIRMWVRIPAWPVAALVSLSKTLNHNCFVLRMGRKAVGPVCCVMHVNEPRTLIVKEKGLAPVFLDSCLEHPAGWICARYKSSVLLLLLLLLSAGAPSLFLPKSCLVSIGNLHGIVQHIYSPENICSSRLLLQMETHHSFTHGGRKTTARPCWTTPELSFFPSTTLVKW